MTHIKLLLLYFFLLYYTINKFQKSFIEWTIEPYCIYFTCYRMMFTECNPSACPVKDQCTNQRFQKHEGIDSLEKFTTEDRGHGVRCTKDIPSGISLIVLGSRLIISVTVLIKRCKFFFKIKTVILNDYAKQYCNRKQSFLN